MTAESLCVQRIDRSPHGTTNGRIERAERG
jgi:hypothetical protein